MMKVGYIVALLISVGIFNSCTGGFMRHNRVGDYQTSNDTRRAYKTVYGNYLAGRVAHIRQDFNNAADYYIQAIKQGADNPDIIGRTYLLLASEGRVEEAAEYAQKAKDAGDNSNFVKFVIMTDSVKKSDFATAHKVLSEINDKAYKKAIIPLFEAWIYAGENNKQQALEELKILNKDVGLDSVYHMHVGMINDYLGDKESAQKSFDTVVENDKLELSYRSLQIIANFYIRNNQKDKAVAVVKKYYDKNPHIQMLEALYNDVSKADLASTAPLLDSATIGLGEAIFNIGVFFRGYQGDVSQILTALAIYLNPKHDVARISMADLLEATGRYSEAIEHYEEISWNSPIYLMAQLKIVDIYMLRQRNQKAFEKLESLVENYPDNYLITFKLGELSRLVNKQDDAIKYYHQSLNALPPEERNNWTIYYALGIAYERNNQWQEAEKALQHALKISNRHPFVLNYLGYTWLNQNQNPNEALYMIFEAYTQNPEDGHIMDSLGWALYRMGKYEDAIKVLERASEYVPTNAVIAEHLGDAYWQVGRKDEARFQWKNALILKEDTGEINREAVQKKIAEGMTKPAIINFNESLLVERLKTLDGIE